MLKKAMHYEKVNYSMLIIVLCSLFSGTSVTMLSKLYHDQTLYDIVV